MLKSTDLEKSVSSTVYGKSKKFVKDYIMTTISEGANDGVGGNVSIPVIQAFTSMYPSLRKKLIELYDYKMSLYDTTGVSEDIKVIQASLFDGLVVGINVESGAQAIYTANFNVIFITNADSKFKADKTVDMNKQGIANAVRVDIDYSSSEGFEYKPVSLNKNTCLSIYDMDTGVGKFHVVPYVLYQGYMEFFKSALELGGVLKVSQILGSGYIKDRYISSNRAILAKYSDRFYTPPGEVEYFPLKGFFYAPVVGAPSTTLGMTRVNLLNVCSVQTVKGDKLNISKVTNPIEAMLLSEVAHKVLTKLNRENIEEFSKVADSLKGLIPKLGTIDGLPSPLDIVSALHEVKNPKEVVQAIPGYAEEYAKLSKIFTSINQEEISHDIDYVRHALNSRVCKVLIKKKDCTYSVAVVTNNRDILKQLYGENYFGEYEGVSSRLYELIHLLKDGAPVALSLGRCGFDYSPSTVDKVMECVNAFNAYDERVLYSELRVILVGDSTRSKERTSNESLILARRCFATSKDDFYAYIDVSNIVSIRAIG